MTIKLSHLDFYKEINNYCASLVNLHISGLPVDHIALKASNSDQYEQWIKELKPIALEFNFIILNNRRIATANLSESIDLGKFGETHYLEIMEPRPEKIGYDLVGLEHMEIYVPSLEDREKLFIRLNIPCQKEGNDFHKTLVVKLNKRGQELKFTNKKIKDILELEEKEGLLIPIN